MGQSFLDFWIRPRFRNYDLTNMVFYSVALCMGVLTGSLVSVFVISTAVYSTVHLATGRLRWAGPKPMKTVALAFVLFFGADAVAFLANPSWISLDEVTENLPFLGFAGVYSITFIDRLKLLRTVEIVAFAVPLVALAVLLFWFNQESRPALAAGNPSVLALLAALIYVINIGSALRRMNRASAGFLLAALAAAYLVILSGTRAIWPILAIAPLVGLVCFGSRKMMRWSIPSGIAALCMVILGLSMSTTVQTRVQALTTDVHAITSGDYSGAIGQRIQIYRAGYELFFQRPLLGYGPGNERKEIARKTAEIYGAPIAYSHAHNALLTSALRSGVLGALALIAVFATPFVTAIRARKDETGWTGFYLLTGLQLVYICSGAVGLSLGHDIHDSVYIAGTCFSLYFVFGRTRAAEGDPRR